MATGAALGGRTSEFQLAAGALDANSVAISKAIGSTYGADAEKAFLPLWQKHIGFFVDYTNGAAMKDTAKKSKAIADLTAYATEFDAFLSGAVTTLPKGAVAQLLVPHVGTLTAAIDAQAANDPKSFELLRTAAAHMPHIATPLAGAIAKQFPAKFPGTAGSPAANLRSTLNAAFQEHVYLAGMATKAAIGGRTAEFQAAAGALDGNSVDISKAIGSIYGADAEKAFLPLWRKHIGFFVDYTTGVATKDDAKKSKAVADLTAYANEFDAFLSGAITTLPKGAVAQLLGPHVTTLAGTVDGQAAGDAKQFELLRTAAGHMMHIADPLAGAIVKQFPAKFAESPAQSSTSPAPTTSAAVAGPNEVFVQGFLFKPATLMVSKGTTVKWTNKDSTTHTVTSGTPDKATTAFSSGLFGQGQTFSKMFDQSGTFAYFCSAHTSMTGTVEVH